MTIFEDPETPEDLMVLINAAKSMGVNDAVGMADIHDKWLQGHVPRERQFENIKMFVLENLS